MSSAATCCVSQKAGNRNSDRNASPADTKSLFVFIGASSILLNVAARPEQHVRVARTDLLNHESRQDLFRADKGTGVVREIDVERRASLHLSNPPSRL
jgi:hypothetical protein